MSVELFRSEGVAKNKDPWLRVFKTHDGYYYASRPGHNSIAFVLVDHIQKSLGLIECMHVPTNKKAVRAFTGSMDVPPGITTVQVCQAEVKEEAGYSVTYKRISQVGVYEVGHQTDELVSLFTVDVTGLVPGDTDPDDFREAAQRVVWDQPTNDWKAILIIDHIERQWDQGIVEMAVRKAVSKA